MQGRSRATLHLAGTAWAKAQRRGWAWASFLDQNELLATAAGLLYVIRTEKAVPWNVPAQTPQRIQPLAAQGTAGHQIAFL